MDCLNYEYENLLGDKVYCGMSAESKNFEARRDSHC
jgi:hypothetical protein